MGFQNVKMNGLKIFHSFIFSSTRYDKDGSGSIEIDEMVEIVGNLFELEGLSKVFFWNSMAHKCQLLHHILRTSESIIQFFVGDQMHWAIKVSLLQFIYTPILQ